MKTYGNIVSFRDLDEATNDALALFGNKDASGIVLLKPYAHYEAEYAERVAELQRDFPLGSQIIGEAEQKRFIALFGQILRLRNILVSFDEFAGNEILTERELQDYQSVYLDLYQEFRRVDEADRESINDDIVFEIELAKQIEVNVDYILMLVQKYLGAKGTGADKEIRATITRAVDASPTLRNKKDLIERFVDSLSATAEVDESWRTFIEARREEELQRIIAEEGLDPAGTTALVENAFRDGAIPTTGTAITKVLPPMSRFSAEGLHGLKKQTVVDRLKAFFDRFSGLA